MRLRFTTLLLVLLLTATSATGMGEPDYLGILAEQSEIKAIAVVSGVQRMSRNSDGTFKRVTFKKVYGLSSFTPKQFVGGCKTMEYGWQKRSPDMVYFKPRKGQKVFVTITTNGGAITSYTPLTRELEAAVRDEPHRLVFSRGEASVRPTDEY